VSSVHVCENLILSRGGIAALTARDTAAVLLTRDTYIGQLRVELELDIAHLGVRSGEQSSHLSELSHVSKLTVLDSLRRALPLGSSIEFGIGSNRAHRSLRRLYADIVHLHGAMELAPVLGLSHLIVDLVDTGSTLRANGLEEVRTIANVTSRLIVNRTAFKTQPERIGGIINRFRQALASGTTQTEG
jgi:hypothetical protein